MQGQSLFPNLSPRFDPERTLFTSDATQANSHAGAGIAIVRWSQPIESLRNSACQQWKSSRRDPPDHLGRIKWFEASSQA